ncbi:hypothetical protein [Streptomyces sp. NPDC095613]|uniref:hypothetical protein n=1 Tax=Streptomyces sp. NPDC095613 TaxID=3155540 RepID=UPI00331A14FA
MATESATPDRPWQTFSSASLKTRITDYAKTAQTARSVGRPDIADAGHSEIDAMLTELDHRKNTGHWHWTADQSRRHFDQAHAGIPMEQWTGVDFETWTNLHLKDAA